VEMAQIGYLSNQEMLEKELTFKALISKAMDTLIFLR
jgi:hypothetical protein